MIVLEISSSSFYGVEAKFKEFPHRLRYCQEEIVYTKAEDTGDGTAIVIANRGTAVCGFRDYGNRYMLFPGSMQRSNEIVSNFHEDPETYIGALILYSIRHKEELKILKGECTDE